MMADAFLEVDGESQSADRARLESERLSAEFHSPLTRDNVRHRLKHGRGPVQLGLLEPAPEPEAQGELF